MLRFESIFWSGFGSSPGIWFRFWSVLKAGLDTGLILGLGSGIELDLTADLGKSASIIDFLTGLGVRCGCETAAAEL